MRQLLFQILMIIGGISLAMPGYSFNTPGGKKRGVHTARKIELREACKPSKSSTDLDINNVRARLLGGGDMWWTGKNGSNEARYIIPKVDPASGVAPVSSLFAGSVWIGGYQGGNLKASALTYRTTGHSWFPGPLNPDDGTTDAPVCARWDRHFEVLGASIRRHYANYKKHLKDGSLPIPADEIPEDVKYWPSVGNEFFADKFGFDLPNEVKRGLAGFHDTNENGIYEPQLGDFPTIEIRGCNLSIEQVPDQMIFWIYNDKGAPSTIFPDAQPIQMEVQAQAFAYQTGDEINDMTFYRYKLINRATQRIDSTYFAMWVDPDLGCAYDDYIGCDTTKEVVLDSFGNFVEYRSRDLMFIYNQDDVDDKDGGDCEGISTYGVHIPILGVDYFRGPKKLLYDSNDIIIDDTLIELGMSSFTYFLNPRSDPIPPGPMQDPNTIGEVYNYMTGSWRDGTRFTNGGTGYNPGSTDYTKYAFPGYPDDENGWSMCALSTNRGDFRTVQASGPFRLDPGVTNELIIGVVWVPDQEYPCPPLDELLAADKKAQDLFDNCFDITDGPAAPDVDFIELDKELIMVLTNPQSSNNYKEKYEERIIGAPATLKDKKYHFEGYRIYQVAGPEVTKSEVGDVNKAREIATFDIKNGIKKIYNWKALPNPDPTQTKLVWSSELKVEGLDKGIKHTLSITKDVFAQGGGGALINHKNYYFLVLAYAQNSTALFNPDKPTETLPIAYIEGRLNVGNEEGFPYKATPRPILYQKLNAKYGTGPEITRYDGVGIGGAFVRVKKSTIDKITEGSFDGTIEYEKGSGPISVQVYDPLRCTDGNFTLFFRDSFDNTKLDRGATWMLVSEDGKDTIFSESTIDVLNEQIIQKYGFTVSIEQTTEPGAREDETNGAIGAEYVYKDLGKDAWFMTMPDNFRIPVNFNGNDVNIGAYDFILSNDILVSTYDPNGKLSKIDNQGFVPYLLCDGQPSNGLINISPAWRDLEQTKLAKSGLSKGGLAKLNNVDIILTSDKSKWSRCVIVETAPKALVDQGLQTVGDALEMQLRASPSVGKDADADGNPVEDGTGVGMGWFPGYAIDVETGQRLNIFFGENSVLRDETLEDFGIEIESKKGPWHGADMMFNPTDELLYPTLLIDNQLPPALAFYTGGQHKIYVTNTPYDSCKTQARYLKESRSRNRKRGLTDVTWAAIAVTQSGTEMLSYADGLIPNDVKISLRVDNPYNYSVGTGINNGLNAYGISFKGITPNPVESKEDIGTILCDDVNVVPNPYYGNSAYESSPLDNRVKITNLPDRSEITIYSLDGRFIRKYDRNEAPRPPKGTGIIEKQTRPDVIWDLKNDSGIPVSSGVYMIRIRDKDTGAECVVKWLGIMRKFDPSTLK